MSHRGGILPPPNELWGACRVGRQLGQHPRGSPEKPRPHDPQGGRCRLLRSAGRVAPCYAVNRSLVQPGGLAARPGAGPGPQHGVGLNCMAGGTVATRTHGTQSWHAGRGPQVDRRPPARGQALECSRKAWVCVGAREGRSQARGPDERGRVKMRAGPKDTRGHGR